MRKSPVSALRRFGGLVQHLGHRRRPTGEFRLFETVYWAVARCSAGLGFQKLAHCSRISGDPCLPSLKSLLGEEQLFVFGLHDSVAIAAPFTAGALLNVALAVVLKLLKQRTEVSDGLFMLCSTENP